MAFLNRSDENSLILGHFGYVRDRTTSALCIISAGLDLLCKRRSTFIFTSHLHELTKLEGKKVRKSRYLSP